MNRVCLFLIICMGLYAQSAAAEDRLKLDKTTILGNGGLPKVTFVVPWRDTPSTVPEWAPQSAERPAVTPLDRELYRRQVEYQKQISRHKDDATTP
ncbi:MAG: hypothetical protein ACLQHK_02865 [Gallionellaceae bacterium]